MLPGEQKSKAAHNSS